MKKYFLFFLLGAFFLTSCKDDKKVSVYNSDSSGLSVKDTKNAESNKNSVSNTDDLNDEGLLQLYAPCGLITLDQLSDIMELSHSTITVKNTANAGKYSSSCFLTWENVANGSESKMFLMLQTNPLPGEFPDWSKSFIGAKINNGDMGYPNTGKPYKYKPVDGFSDSAYNEELKRIFWRVNSDYVLAVYFNAGFTSKNRVAYAEKFAKIMNKNLQKKI